MYDSNEVKARMAEFDHVFELAFQMCENKNDMLMLASLMLTHAHKLFSVAYMDEESANKMIMSYVIDKSENPMGQVH